MSSPRHVHSIELLRMARNASQRNIPFLASNVMKRTIGWLLLYINTCFDQVACKNWFFRPADFDKLIHTEPYNLQIFLIYNLLKQHRYASYQVFEKSANNLKGAKDYADYISGVFHKFDYHDYNTELETNTRLDCFS